MENTINSFRGEYFFLSNMYKTPVTYNGLTYQNSEAAFQAQKTLDENIHKTFTTMTGIKAKEKGRQLKIREDWDKVKVEIMREILYIKFTENIVLKEKLLSTEDLILIEGNTWNDTFWGVCNGIGENMLGILLMETRNKLKNALTKKLKN